MNPAASSFDDAAATTAAVAAASYSDAADFIVDELLLRTQAFMDAAFLLDLLERDTDLDFSRLAKHLPDGARAFEMLVYAQKWLLQPQNRWYVTVAATEDGRQDVIAQKLRSDVPDEQDGIAFARVIDEGAVRAPLRHECLQVPRRRRCEQRRNGSDEAGRDAQLLQPQAAAASAGRAAATVVCRARQQRGAAEPVAAGTAAGRFQQLRHQHQLPRQRHHLRPARQHGPRP